MKKCLKWTNILAILLLSIFIPAFCFPRISKNLMLAYKTESGSLNVYTVWHIETFEGGGRSRLTYLQNMALQFEKMNAGKLFMIKSVEPDQLTQALKDEVPHIFSFGWGVGDEILPYLKSLNKEYNVRDDILKSAVFNGKLVCVPYILNGYCYFTKEGKTADQLLGEKQPLYVQNVGYTSALTAYKNKTTDVNNGENLTSYEAYVKFISGNAKILLGTGRDLFRTQNLISQGRLECTNEYVEGYSDLIQYIGISSYDKYVNSFIELLLTDAAQQKFSDYSLFSTKNLTLYSTGAFAEMEKVLQKKLNVPNVFRGK